MRSGRSRTSRQLILATAILAAAALVGLALRAANPGTPTALTAESAPAATGGVAARIDRIYRRLTPAQKTGQRVIGGFEGRTVPRGFRAAIRDGRFGGVILFSDNLGSRRQIRRLIRDLQRIPRPDGLRGAPLLMMVDQEGGLVKRLAGAPRVSAAEMGVRGRKFARREGVRTGRNLVNAGFNVDLAPVLDVARPGGVIDQTDRAFGHTAKRVGRIGVAFADGLRAGGVAATAKHFPGLGAAGENTDFAVQRIRLSRHQLRRIDLKPFGRFADSGGDLVMVGTAIYPAFGPSPAAFNRRIVVGELRRRLGFSGVTITDSLGATAARAFGGPGRSAVAAARAGMDLMLYGDWETALRGQRAMARKLRAGKLSRIEFRGAVARTLNLRTALRQDR